MGIVWVVVVVYFLLVIAGVIKTVGMEGVRYEQKRFEVYCKNRKNFMKVNHG